MSALCRARSRARPSAHEPNQYTWTSAPRNRRAKAASCSATSRGRSGDGVAAWLMGSIQTQRLRCRSVPVSVAESSAQLLRIAVSRGDESITSSDLVTHDPHYAEYAEPSIHLFDGRCSWDPTPGAMKPL